MHDDPDVLAGSGSRDEVVEEGPAFAPADSVNDVPIRSESVLARRQRILLIVACGTAMMSTGGLVASAFVKSPAQVAADSRAPKASVMTEAVVSKKLSSTVVFRGTFATQGSVSFTPTSAQAPGGSGRTSGNLVVSKLVRRGGAKIRPGQVVVEVSYRPIIVLKGKVPAIRDLIQGVSGPDIVQLQQALAGAGYNCGGDSSGTFGAGTAGAVRRLYTYIGYPVPSQAVAAGDSSGGVANGQPGSSSKRQQKRRSKVLLPMSEVMFVPSFPAVLAGISARVGDKVSGTLVTLSTGGLQLTAQLDPSRRDTVKPGQRVDVLSEITGDHTAGTVASVGKVVLPGQSSTGTQDGGTSAQGGTAEGPAAGGTTPGQSPGMPYVPVTIDPVHVWKRSLAGQDVRLTISAAATAGPVLAVPQSAITSATDGVTSVTVFGHDGNLRRVQVRAGISADGLVQVTPIGSEGLREGDKVVTGR
ncbi:MAG: hypothetical protein JWN52_2766 [Actinomycetia bacterium]|nr:hypothetical protein [Actinomycetes bacterium]